MDLVREENFIMFIAPFLGMAFNLVFTILWWRAWGISRYKGWLLLACASTFGLLAVPLEWLSTPILTARFDMSDYIFIKSIISTISVLLRNIPFLVGVIFLVRREGSLREIREASIFQ